MLTAKHIQVNIKESISIKHYYLIIITLFQGQPDTTARTQRLCFLCISKIKRKFICVLFYPIHNDMTQISNRKHHPLHVIAGQIFQQIP